MDASAMPGEFPAVGIAPSHFTVPDLVRIGVYLARQTPNGDGEEIDNMKAVDAGGPRVFDRILPLRVKGQVSTVPRANGLFPSDPGRTRAQERAALLRSYKYVRTLPVPADGDLGTEPAFQPPAGSGSRATTAFPTPIKHGGSYMVAVGDRRHHHAFLFNGPELGWLAPEELYEIELHGPGLNVRGITAPGAPVVAIGHNEHVPFGLT